MNLWINEFLYLGTRLLRAHCVFTNGQEAQQIVEPNFAISEVSNEQFADLTHLRAVREQNWYCSVTPLPCLIRAQYPMPSSQSAMC